MTFWADFITFDISFSQNVEPTDDFAILIPSDDVNYLSENTQGITQINQVIEIFVNFFFFSKF